MAQQLRMDKITSYAPVPSPVPKCCDKVTHYIAATAIRADIGERGYILQSPSCECNDRWLPGEWGKVEFVTINKGDK